MTRVIGTVVPPNAFSLPGEEGFENDRAVINTGARENESLYRAGGKRIAEQLQGGNDDSVSGSSSSSESEESEEEGPDRKKTKVPTILR